MTNKAAMTQRQRADRERRARYASSRDINGILAAMRATEAELIAADLANNCDKPQQNRDAALKLQIKFQGRDAA